MTHKITANPTVKFHLSGMPDDERECASPTIEIEYSYTRGASDSYSIYGWDQGYAAEVDLVKATLIDGDGLRPDPDQLREWAQDWLDDEGYQAACDNAEGDRRPDPDDARERRRDDAREL